MRASRCAFYARDSRDDAALVEDVLERASGAGIAG
jgi:hypothetical protein